MLGQSCCRVHGGAAPQNKKSAKERLLELADPAIAALSKIVNDEDTDDTVRLRAALGIMDRIGLGPGAKLEVGRSKWDETLEAVFLQHQRDGIGGIQRSELEDVSDRPALAVGVGADEPWEDAEQHAYDERERQWAEYDAEDGKPYTTRLDPFGPDVVRGEVVAPVVRPGSARPDPGPLDPPGYDPERGRWG
ncbi:hypothetical protein [Nocardioides sp.]|uniref:hypothetical protein n=1 Tax=Nocardioides sp. TaxID=35761 RepID=UPI0037839489